MINFWYWFDLPCLSLIQIKDEVKGVLEFISYAYKIFGFTFDLKLSTVWKSGCFFDLILLILSHCDVPCNLCPVIPIHVLESDFNLLFFFFCKWSAYCFCGVVFLFFPLPFALPSVGFFFFNFLIFLIFNFLYIHNFDYRGQKNFLETWNHGTKLKLLFLKH